MNGQGTLTACLKAFRGTDRSNDRLLAEFCQVTLDTVQRWNEKRLPKGEPLNRLWYVLEHYGYPVDDLDRLHPAVRYLGKLVAFDVLTKSEALLLLKLKNEQQLWAALQGRLTPMRVKSQEVTVELLREEHDELLQLAIGAYLPQLSLTPRSVAPRPPVSRAPKPPAVPEEVNAPDPIITMAVASLKALKPLLLHVRASGPEAVDQLRAGTGTADYHDVLDLLKEFSSRKAQQFYRGT